MQKCHCERTLKTYWLETIFTNNFVSSLLSSFWTKTRTGDRQDAVACADRALSPSGVQEALDSGGCERKQSDPLQMTVPSWLGRRLAAGCSVWWFSTSNQWGDKRSLFSWTDAGCAVAIMPACWISPLLQAILLFWIFFVTFEYLYSSDK